MVKSTSIVIFCLIALMGVTLMSACARNTAIQVGFTADLSGKDGNNSVQLRNGVQMAVDEINQQGGIGGRAVELVVKDDGGTPEGARQAQEQLNEAGVAAVIGHFTSNQTIEGLRVAAAQGRLLLSATAATHELSGQKDLFFRTVPATDAMGRTFGRYLVEQRGINVLAIIFDQDNQTYCEGWLQSVEPVLLGQGGEIHEVTFSARSSPDYTPLVAELLVSEPDGMLIIASPGVTAVIAQEVRLAGWQGPLFTTGWAQSEDLIYNGGSAVEGMEMLISINLNDPSDPLENFKAQYESRFGQAPNFAAVEGYETMLVLSQALKETGGAAQGLGDALLEFASFTGLTGPIEMDEFGDAYRPMYIIRIQNGALITKTILQSSPLEEE